MTEAVQAAWHRFTAGIRRVFHSFEDERTADSSTWQLTLRTQRDDLDGGWIAWVDELPGCVSEGATDKEALDNLGEAINLVLEVKIEEALARVVDEHPSDSEPSLRHVRIA